MIQHSNWFTTDAVEICQTKTLPVVSLPLQPTQPPTNTRYTRHPANNNCLEEPVVHSDILRTDTNICTNERLMMREMREMMGAMMGAIVCLVQSDDRAMGLVWNGENGVKIYGVVVVAVGENEEKMMNSMNPTIVPVRALHDEPHSMDSPNPHPIPTGQLHDISDIPTLHSTIRSNRLRGPSHDTHRETKRRGRLAVVYRTTMTTTVDHSLPNKTNTLLWKMRRGFRGFLTGWNVWTRVLSYSDNVRIRYASHTIHTIHPKFHNQQ